MLYVDTSALIKRYITEANSDAFDLLFVTRAPLSISRLTLVEMRCSLARRRRNGSIDTVLAARVMDEVRTDLQDGALAIYPIQDDQAVLALRLIDAVAPLPLRTLDAIHLATAQRLAASALATADR